MPRIQYEGALYHIISRGNFRQDLFTFGNTGRAFEKAIFEASERCGWVLHAYVIMSNHYHLVLETPQGNLVEGMRWLQGTFANRFNRFNGTIGHVFQGRYKSILQAEGSSLVALVDYVHLNPVRAGLVSVESLRTYRLSSYPKFFKRKVELPLRRDGFLGEAGLGTGLRAMRLYEQNLQGSEAAEPGEAAELRKKFERGWAKGSQKAKKELVKDLREMTISQDWGGRELAEMNELRWEEMVLGGLRKHGKTEDDLSRTKKGADWKVSIARDLRRHTSATNPWIAKRLHMGHPVRVSMMAGGKNVKV